MIDYYCINLDRDKTRLANVSVQFEKENIKPKRISGVNGSKIQTGKFITLAHGTLGCFLSHIKTWKTFLKYSKQPYAVVFEDDVVLKDNFTNKFHNVLKNVPSEFDILYLTCFVGSLSQSPSSQKKYNILGNLLHLLIHPTRKRIIINTAIYIPHMSLGMHGYCLSRDGARKLIQ